jgi:carbon monoxide dehydrogenase subunit G
LSGTRHGPYDPEQLRWALRHELTELGPIALQYNGTGRYLERDESAYRAVIEAKGKDKRGNGTANATVTAQLRSDGGVTAVRVTTDLAVTGKPAQFGRGVMQDVSDKLLGQFVTCLQATLGEPEAVQVSAAGVQPAQPTGGAAAGVQPAQPTGGAAARTPEAAAYRPATHPAPAVDVELNLLRTVGHVLLTRYAARALGPAALIVGYLLGRRSGRRLS